MKKNEKNEVTHFYGRFPKEINKKLEALAKIHHTSKNSIVINAIEVYGRYAEILKKIGDKQ